MPTNHLNTQNPNQLEYTNKLLKIAVLGGIRLDGLDRMRVTVKIQEIGRASCRERVLMSV